MRIATLQAYRELRKGLCSQWAIERTHESEYLELCAVNKLENARALDILLNITQPGKLNGHSLRWRSTQTSAPQKSQKHF